MHTLALVYDDTAKTLEYFVDGVSIGQEATASTGSILGSFGLKLSGVESGPTALAAVYRAQKLALWHRTLTAQEILDYHNNNDIMLN